LAFEAAGSFHDAIASLRTASQLAPDSAEAHYHLGLTLRKVGDTKGASNALVRAAANAPDDAHVQEALAEVMAERRVRSPTPMPGVMPRGSLTDSSASFSGDLAILQLPEMLEFLMHQRATGVLRVVCEYGEGSIELFGGKVARVRSPNGKALSAVLEENDLATETDIRRALDGAHDPRDDMKVAERLLGSAVIDRRTLADAFAKQAQSALAELVSWRTGQVTFKAMPGDSVRRDPEFLMESRLLLMEAMREIDEQNR
jgi:hypothetical protein